jgi:hypothetical protein
MLADLDDAIFPADVFARAAFHSERRFEVECHARDHYDPNRRVSSSEEARMGTRADGYAAGRVKKFAASPPSA